MLSGCSVVKIEVHVGKKRTDVGKNKAHVGIIAIDVGISKKMCKRTENPILENRIVTLANELEDYEIVQSIPEIGKSL